MLKLLKKHKNIIFLLSFAYIYLLFILIYPSKTRVLTPGEISNVEGIYEIENIEINDNFNTLSVYNWHNVSVFQKWITENNKRFEQSKIRDDLNRKDLNKQGRISNDSSHNNAVIAAYTFANKKDENINIDYKLNSLTIYDSNTSLLIGSEIIKINNQKIDTNSYEDYLNKFNLFNNNTISNSTDEITYMLDDKEYNYKLSKDDVLIIYPKYEILKTSPKYLGFKENLNVGGPSGGAIQAISLYSSLLNLNLGSVNISGTGTINTNNTYKIGNIGGVVQKYYTALNNKADYLILPTDNYDELIKEIPLLSDKMIVLRVESFSDLINLLGDING